MGNKIETFDLDAFQRRLKTQLYKHRKALGLKQADVADLIGKSPDTYQRWECTGKHLTDIGSLLDVFQALHFSTGEILGVLGLPPLTLDEIKALYRDEGMLKAVRESGFCPILRESCPDMEDSTLDMLLFLLLGERLKRLEKGR